MRTVYFDNSATTPLCESAASAMKSVIDGIYGNPSSVHAKGMEAHGVLREARMAVLSALGVRQMQAKEENLIFTASGTEADNMATVGVAHAKKANMGGKIISTDSEHPAILRALASLEKEGYRVAYIPTRGGVFDMERFYKEMTPDTFLVSIMLVNNETGQVNDIRAISDHAKKINADCVVHTDAVQGFLKIPFTPERLGADLVTVSAHKIHGPKGVGALYIAPGVHKRRAISPVIFGGGQEFGLRAGTENLPGIAGFGAAAREGAAALLRDIAHMEHLRERLLLGISHMPELSRVVPHIPESHLCAPHILSIGLPGIKSETMLNYLSGQGICVSAGSACSAQSGRVSSTLVSFGLSEREADTTLRISISPYNTAEEVDYFLSALAAGVSSLVRMRR